MIQCNAIIVVNGNIVKCQKDEGHINDPAMHYHFANMDGSLYTWDDVSVTCTLPIQDFVAHWNQQNKMARVIRVANDTQSILAEWMLPLKSRIPDAVIDSMTRLENALLALGMKPKQILSALEWRRSIYDALNKAGFYPKIMAKSHTACVYPMHVVNWPGDDIEIDEVWVYDPDAPHGNPPRIFGDANGPTLTDIVRQWRDFKNNLSRRVKPDENEEWDSNG